MNQIAVIGLAAMGKNLAKNFASKGYKVAVYNRHFDRTEDLLDEGISGINGYQDLLSLVESLEKPRKIILLVKSGSPVDDMINELEPLLEEGDILIDSGNSYWKDTDRRQKALMNNSKQIQFIGCGISGGAMGALLGPSIMPGGNQEVLQSLLPLFESVAARDFVGGACVTNVGLGASGHFVKMVHNGIEYAIMQGIAEIYSLFRYCSLSQEKMAEIFSFANQIGKPTNSYLLDVTIEALRLEDSNGLLLPKIDQKAGAKGTGRWTVEAALELGVAVPSIAEAVFARILSTDNLSFPTSQNMNPEFQKVVDFTEHKRMIEDLIFSLFFISYLQGLDLIKQANNAFGWGIKISEVVRIWQGGCIIRSKILEELITFDNQDFESVDSSFSILKRRLDFIQSQKARWNYFKTNYELAELPFPVINSIFDYCTSLLSESHPTNLTQLQRNIFGEHPIVVNSL